MQHNAQLKVTWPRRAPHKALPYQGRKGQPRPAETYRAARRNKWFCPTKEA